ncbi:MAG: DNA polymerase subunit beta [Desulfurococcaceae archaeon]
MSRVKVRYSPEFREVVYSEDHWNLLKGLRREACRVMSVFAERGIETWLHGSVARGDVYDKSDIDIVIPRRIPGYLVELVLEEGGLKPYARYLVAATPTTTLKAYIALDEEERVTLSFPLVDFKSSEIEFYRYGGILTYRELMEDKRVPGVNKTLTLIVPTNRGHLEMPVIGYEDRVARILGVSVSVVRERVEVLTRRDEVGRTGIFAKIALSPSETFEEGLERLFRERPLLRKIYSGLV